MNSFCFCIFCVSCTCVAFYVQFSPFEALLTWSWIFIQLLFISINQSVSVCNKAAEVLERERVRVWGQRPSEISIVMCMKHHNPSVSPGNARVSKPLIYWCMYIYLWCNASMRRQACKRCVQMSAINLVHNISLQIRCILLCSFLSLAKCLFAITVHLNIKF